MEGMGGQGRSLAAQWGGLSSCTRSLRAVPGTHQGWGIGVTVFLAVAVVMVVNGSSWAGSCSACEAVPLWAVCRSCARCRAARASVQPPAAHTGMCPGARVQYPPRQSSESVSSMGGQEEPGAWTACGCSVPLICSCPHSDGSHQKEAGDCGRWCLRKDVPADRVQQGPIPRGLRAHRV